MPQLIALGLIGGLAWYGYRALKKHMDAINQDLRNREAKGKPGDVGKLKKDADGVYRPADDSEE